MTAVDGSKKDAFDFILNMNQDVGDFYIWLKVNQQLTEKRSYTEWKEEFIKFLAQQKAKVPL